MKELTLCMSIDIELNWKINVHTSQWNNLISVHSFSLFAVHWLRLTVLKNAFYNFLVVVTTNWVKLTPRIVWIKISIFMVLDACDHDNVYLFIMNNKTHEIYLLFTFQCHFQYNWHLSPTCINIHINLNESFLFFHVLQYMHRILSKVLIQSVI